MCQHQSTIFPFLFSLSFLSYIHQDENVNFPPCWKHITWWPMNTLNLPPTLQHKKSVNRTIDLNALFPSDRIYANYPGSLTTPPCSEGIAWHLFTTVRKGLTITQLETLQNALATGLVYDKSRTYNCKASGSSGPLKPAGCASQYSSRTNNRAVQPINGRVLYRSRAS